MRNGAVYDIFYGPSVSPDAGLQGAGLKKVAVLIAVLSLAVVLSSCGGGSTASTEASGTPGATTTPGAAVPVAAPAPRPGVPRPFEKTPKTPEFFVDALNKGLPVFVFFYGDDDVSQDVLAEAKKVYEDKYYSGGATFLLLKMDENDQVKKLAREFDVTYIPYVAVVNRAEVVTFEKNGYVDSQVLQQALYDAMNK